MRLWVRAGGVHVRRSVRTCVRNLVYQALDEWENIQWEKTKLGRGDTDYVAYLDTV